MTARRYKEALRAAGYVRVPTLWVLPDELEVIYRIAVKHLPEVKRIEREADGCD